ncbi:PKD domain-containing protein, partial [Crocinitomix catalasitica]|uniref:PKD domain-containing protein n=1 Tax=Crocinitomix catalasitica TaxID=184607 RepID=UPI0012FB66CA
MKLLTLILCFFSLSAFSQEICNNGIDDDGDLLIDLNDSDCDCFELDGFSSLIPNPSFEDTLCCDYFPSLRCSDAWTEANWGSSDFYHLCDLFLGFDTPAVIPLPGGGEGYVGLASRPSFCETVGTCLFSPMMAGRSYTLNFYTAWSEGEDFFELHLYGTPECDDLPWAGGDCPIGFGEWQDLADVEINYIMDGSWQEVTFTFTPLVDIYAIALAKQCGSEVIDGITYPNGYYYFDELTLIDSDHFTDISQTGDWCDGNLLLTAIIDTLGGDWQWYKDGIALVGETSSTVSASDYGLGIYTAQYTIGERCLRLVETIHFPDVLDANFSFENVCLGEAIDFDNISTIPEDDVPTWEWDFGDGESSTDDNPSHVYDEAGTYTVTLIGHSDISCNDTATYEVVIYDVPAANIEFIAGGASSEVGSTGGCIINPVQFNDISTVIPPSEITSWNWSFGDGGTSTDENPTHTYDAIGTYTITLTVTGTGGCSSTTTKNITMTNGIPLDIISNEPTCYGFKDGSIIINVDGGGDDLIFTVIDEDGLVRNVDNSNAANSLGAGTYTYTVTDDSECSGSGTITLNEPSEMDINLTTVDPLCYGDKTGYAIVDEVFNATGDLGLINFNWSPAGLSGIAEDSAGGLGAGEHIVNVIDANGCSNSFSFIIDQPDSLRFVEFEFEPAYCRLYNYQKGNGVVKAAMAGGIPDYDYLWTNLSTGETSTNSTWGGLNPGQYEMVATDENGCTLTQILTVDSLNPRANFEITSPQFTSNYKGTANVETHYTNTSQHFANPNNPLSDTTFFWNFNYLPGDWILSES